jgi:hypothetical protein
MNKFEAYAIKKAQFDSLKKEVEKLNIEIKEEFEKAGITETVLEDGRKLEVTKSNRVSWKEELLINLLKGLGSKAVILKETVDEATLEKEIYHGILSAESIAPAQEVKEVVSLRFKK